MKASGSYTSSFKVTLVKLLMRYLVVAAISLYATDLFFTHIIIPDGSITNYAKIHRLIYDELPEEIPVFGSSTVLRGILAEELGENFFNYGITATNFQKIEPLLQIELAKDKITPIIIEMPPQFFYARPQPNIRIEDMLPFNQERVINNFMKTYDFHEPWHNIPGMRYFGHYTTYFVSYLNVAPPTDVLFSKGGKHIKRKTSPTVFSRFVERRKNKPLPFESEPELLNRFKELITNTDRPIFLVVPPLYKTVYETGFSLTGFNKLISELSAAHPHIYGMAVDGRLYPKDHFTDTIHLNYDGALRFTGELRKALTQAGMVE